MKPAIKWTLIGSGAMTIAGPMLGVLGTVLGMVGSFNSLGESGVGDPQALSSHISTAMLSTAGGFLLGGIGLVAFIVTLVVWLSTRSRTKVGSI